MEIVHCGPNETSLALARKLARALDARLTLAAGSHEELKSLSSRLNMSGSRAYRDMTPENAGDLTIVSEVRLGARLLKATLHPVLVARSESELSRILLCSGGSHQFDRAVDFSIQLALGLGARVTLFHVMASPPALFADFEERPPNEQALLNRVLREQEARLRVAGLEYDVAAAWGDVTREVRRKQHSGNYDLVVVGSSARSLMLGDVTAETLSAIDCPVLVVPTHQPVGLFQRLGRWLKQLAS